MNLSWQSASLYRRLLRQPGRLIVALLVLLAGAATQWSEIRFDASSETLVVEGDALFNEYQRFRQSFADDNFILVAVRPQTGSGLAGRDGLAVIDAVQQRLGAISGVTATLSLLDVPIVSQGRQITLRDSTTDITGALDFLQSQPLFAEQLISASGDTASIRVALASSSGKAQNEHKGDSGNTLGLVRAALADPSWQAEFYIGGVPLIAHDMVTFVQRDVQTFSAAIALIMIVTLAWFFRRVRWVVLNLLPAVAAVAIGAGLLGALDVPLSVISANSVSLLAIFSISFSIHLVVRYRELLRTEPDLSHSAKVESTMLTKFAPCAFTALTTMVAFTSLTTSGIPPVVDFGWMMSAGIALGLLLTYWLFPAALLLLPAGQPSSTLGKPIGAVDALSRLSQTHPKPVTAAALLALAVGIAGMTQIELGGTFSSYFRDGTQVRDGLRFIDEELGGVLPLNVVLDLELPEVDPDDPFADPGTQSWTRGLDDAVLTSLAELTGALRARDDVGSATSLADVVALLATAEPGVRSDSFARSIALNALAESQGDALIAPYIDAAGEQLRVSLRMRENASPARYPDVLQEVTQLAVDAGFDAQHVSLTGMYILYGDSLRTLFESQRSTVFAVLLATFVMFLLLLRSLRFAFLGIAANCVAATLVLGFMGWTGLTLDMMTITIAAISIGIGVDDAIHYLHRYREELNSNGGDVRAAIAASHGSIGRAAYFTSCVIALGFIVLLLSNFVPTATFGLLTAVAMGVAFIANLLLLPSLLVLLDKREKAAG